MDPKEWSSKGLAESVGISEKTVFIQVKNANEILSALPKTNTSLPAFRREENKFITFLQFRSFLTSFGTVTLKS
jgi:hypothetical protein